MAKGQKATVKATKSTTSTSFDEAALKGLCTRWQKGVALKELAAEAGVSWQTLAGHFIAKGWKRDANPKANPKANTKGKPAAKSGKGKKGSAKDTAA